MAEDQTANWGKLWVDGNLEHSEYPFAHTPEPGLLIHTAGYPNVFEVENSHGVFSSGQSGLADHAHRTNGQKLSVDVSGNAVHAVRSRKARRQMRARTLRRAGRRRAG